MAQITQISWLISHWFRENLCYSVAKEKTPMSSHGDHHLTKAIIGSAIWVWKR